MTQPIYETTVLEKFLDGAKDSKIKIMAGILPLVSYRHASFMHHEVPGITVPSSIMDKLHDAGEDALDVSIELTVELLEKIKNLVSGVYFMPSFGRYNIIAEIIRKAGLSRAASSDRVSV
jgi:homocysteine S-methyltransferase